MPSSIDRSAPADKASLPEVMTTPFTAASAEVCFTISSSSLIEVSSSTFIERPGVSHVASTMPSASVSTLKFLKAMLVAPNLVFPSPLVGEGGENKRSGFETDEGFVSADRDPSPALASRGHPLPQGERGRIKPAR